jgi:pteridine reductase
MSPVVLVTGGAQRIGSTLCRRFHEQGYRVLIHCHHSIDPAAELADELNRARQASAAVIQQDLQQAGSLAAMAKQAVEVYGRIDLLINNASAFYPTPVAEVSVDAIDELMAVNFRAPLLLCRHLAGDVSSIINIADIFGEKPLATYSAYSASKAALIMMTRSLAIEMTPVRVNAISPGAILWPEDTGGWDQPMQRTFLEKVPLGKLGDTDNIAEAALFLAENNYVTGTVLKVDGGRSLS